MMRVRGIVVALIGVVALAACGGWTQPGFDAGRGGWSSLDGSFTPANIAGLSAAWEYDGFGTNSQISSPVSDGARVFVRSTVSGAGTLWAFDGSGGTACSGAPRQCQPRWTATLPFPSQAQPIVAEGMVLVAGADGGNWDVVGYAADGGNGCSGSPRICVPIWRARWAGGPDFGALDLLSSGGLLYGSAGLVQAPGGTATTYALDPTGGRSCSGTAPVTCVPLFSASTDASTRAAAANGLLLLGSTTGAVAFDATGTTNCSGTPKVCQPLRRYGTPNGAAFIAVAGPTLYVGNLDPHFNGPWVGKVYGYDVAGGSGCSGNPVVCLPRFVASAGLTPNPVVANGRLFVLTGDPLVSESLDGVDVAGGTGCVGTIPFCARVRSSTLPQGFVQIGATKSILFAVTSGNGLQPDTGRLLGFGVGSDGCHGAPVVCDPLVSIPIPPNVEGVAPFAGHVAVGINASPAHGTSLLMYAVPG